MRWLLLPAALMACNTPASSPAPPPEVVETPALAEAPAASCTMLVAVTGMT